MGFVDYSITPASNVSLNGIDVSKGCSSRNVNDAIRQLAADGKALSNTVSNLPASTPSSGGAFVGDISRQTRGSYLHHHSGSLADGRCFVLGDGAGDPAGTEGSIALFYS